MFWHLQSGWNGNLTQGSVRFKPRLAHNTLCTNCFAPYDSPWSLFSLPFNSRRSQTSSFREAEHAEYRLALMRPPFFPHLNSKCYLEFFFFPWARKPSFKQKHTHIRNVLLQILCFSFHPRIWSANTAFSGKFSVRIEFVRYIFCRVPLSVLTNNIFPLVLFNLLLSVAEESTAVSLHCNSVYHSVTPYSGHAIHPFPLVDDCAFCE